MLHCKESTKVWLQSSLDSPAASKWPVHPRAMSGPALHTKLQTDGNWKETGSLYNCIGHGQTKGNAKIKRARCQVSVTTTATVYKPNSMFESALCTSTDQNNNKNLFFLHEHIMKENKRQSKRCEPRSCIVPRYYFNYETLGMYSLHKLEGNKSQTRKFKENLRNTSWDSVATDQTVTEIPFLLYNEHFYSHDFFP